MVVCFCLFGSVSVVPGALMSLCPKNMRFYVNVLYMFLNEAGIGVGAGRAKPLKSAAPGLPGHKRARPSA